MHFPLRNPCAFSLKTEAPLSNWHFSNAFPVLIGYFASLTIDWSVSAKDMSFSNGLAFCYVRIIMYITISYSASFCKEETFIQCVKFRCGQSFINCIKSSGRKFIRFISVQ